MSQTRGAGGTSVLPAGLMALNLFQALVSCQARFSISTPATGAVVFAAALIETCV